MTMMMTIRVTSFSAFWVVADSCCWAAAYRDTRSGVQTVATLGKELGSPHSACMSPVPSTGPYLLDGEDQLSVAEEYDNHRDGEVDHEHVDDKGLVVDLRLEGVVVNPTRALHALWDVPEGRQRLGQEGA